jgi:hypothetical protein
MILREIDSPHLKNRVIAPLEGMIDKVLIEVSRKPVPASVVLGCKAFTDSDPSLMGEVPPSSLSAPYLFILSEEPRTPKTPAADP